MFWAYRFHREKRWRTRSGHRMRSKSVEQKNVDGVHIQSKLSVSLHPKDRVSVLRLRAWRRAGPGAGPTGISSVRHTQGTSQRTRVRHYLLICLLTRQIQPCKILLFVYFIFVLFMNSGGYLLPIHYYLSIHYFMLISVKIRFFLIPVYEISKCFKLIVCNWFLREVFLMRVSNFFCHLNYS